MRVYSLAEFPAPPSLGTVTLEESEEYFYNEKETPNVLENYHRDTFPELSWIRIQDELGRRPHGSRTSTFLLQPHLLSAKGCILRPPPGETWPRLCMDAYMEHGLYGLLHHLASARAEAEANDPSAASTRSVPPLPLTVVARVSLSAIDFTGSVCAFIRGIAFPQLQLTPEEVCAKYSEVANWQAGLVRALAWHPGTKKFAIALRNDSVILYNKNSTTSSELKHPKQTNVTCIAFRPFSGTHIAVGCEQGLLMWNIAASITVKTPTMHSASLLLPGTLVSDIAWHPDGNLLAVCSARFGDIKVLSPATGEIVALTTFSLLPSAHLLKWSRDGFRIFAACPNGGFDIWEGNPVWDAQKYKTAMVTAACWSYDGCQLLFAVEGDARLFQLSLNPVGEPMAATPKPKAIISFDGHPNGISGEVSMLQWERNCQRLAVAFKHPSPLIAVFKTSVKPLFSIKPLGFIRGPSNPEAMKFCDDQDDGALLTVCWSVGVVQHIPMRFEVTAADRSIVLSRSAVSEISGDFSNDSANLHP